MQSSASESPRETAIVQVAPTPPLPLIVSQKRLWPTRLSSGRNLRLERVWRLPFPVS
jgi:hypothetical protein